MHERKNPRELQTLLQHALAKLSVNVSELMDLVTAQQCEMPLGSLVQLLSACTFQIAGRGDEDSFSTYVIRLRTAGHQGHHHLSLKDLNQ